jgi:sterol desaturase/sphingolipid hydroxylase (fatty acid hydroxylase superfamily)
MDRTDGSSRRSKIERRVDADSELRTDKARRIFEDHKAIIVLVVVNVLLLFAVSFALRVRITFDIGLKLVFFVSTSTMYLYERKLFQRSWPSVTGWWWRSLVFTGIQASVVYYSGPLWDDWLEHNRAWSIGESGAIAGTLVAFLVMTFVSYWQHRIKHMVPILWRYLHQLHHSPKRLELLTSYYRNPLEIFLNMFVISAVLYLIVGSTKMIAANAVLLLGMADMFYHWNVRTPRWIGYIIQRPESHCIHHCTGVHAYNFGDLAVWDILFGTFKNPRQYKGACGFSRDAEQHFVAMLLGRDMSLGQHRYGTARLP